VPLQGDETNPQGDETNPQGDETNPILDSVCHNNDRKKAKPPAFSGTWRPLDVRGATWTERVSRFTSRTRREASSE